LNWSCTLFAIILADNVSEQSVTSLQIPPVQPAGLMK